MLYRASGVDSITDYEGFSPRRSLEVDMGHRVYLTFLFKATFQFNYFFDIYFCVLQAACSLTEVLK